MNFDFDIEISRDDDTYDGSVEGTYDSNDENGN